MQDTECSHPPAFCIAGALYFTFSFAVPFVNSMKYIYIYYAIPQRREKKNYLRQNLLAMMKSTAQDHSRQVITYFGRMLQSCEQSSNGRNACVEKPKR